MNLDEVLAREAIRHTIASYNKCGDSDDAEGFAGCFTEDGVFDAPSVYHQGREAIRAWKAGSTAFSHGKGGATAAFRVHHLAATQIEFIDGDHARTRTPWLVVTDIGPDHSGVYHDILRREGDRWLIERRAINCLWRAADSCLDVAMVGRRSDLK